MMRFMRRPNNRPEAVLLERILLTGSCRKDQRYKTASDAFRSRFRGVERLQRGHEERFPPTKLSAGCGFRKETIAGICRNGRDAPIPDACRGGFPLQFDTDSGPSLRRAHLSDVPRADIRNPPPNTAAVKHHQIPAAWA